MPEEYQLDTVCDTEAAAAQIFLTELKNWSTLS